MVRNTKIGLTILSKPYYRDFPYNSRMDFFGFSQVGFRVEYGGSKRVKSWALVSKQTIAKNEIFTDAGLLRWKLYIFKPQPFSPSSGMLEKKFSFTRPLHDAKAKYFLWLMQEVPFLNRRKQEEMLFWEINEFPDNKIYLGFPDTATFNSITIPNELDKLFLGEGNPKLTNINSPFRVLKK